MKPWTQRHRRWLDALPFELLAHQATLADYLYEVDHAAARVTRLERALDEAVAAAPAPMRAVMAALQTLRGIRQVTAATIVSEVGALSRFPHPREPWAPRSVSGGSGRASRSGLDFRGVAPA